RIALALFGRDLIDNERLLLSFRDDLVRLRVVADQNVILFDFLIETGRLNRLLADLQQARVKRGRLLAGYIRRYSPIFSFLERFDLALTFDHHAQRDGLHASGAEATTDCTT